MWNLLCALLAESEFWRVAAVLLCRLRVGWEMEIGSFETLKNAYYTKMLDYNLSEKDLPLYILAIYKKLISVLL